MGTEARLPRELERDFGSREGGYADVLQWALDTASGSVQLLQVLCYNAVNPEVLKVLRDHGCEWSAKTCALLAEYGELELLQWAALNGCAG